MTASDKHTIEVSAEDQEVLERAVESNTADSLEDAVLAQTAAGHTWISARSSGASD